MPLRWVLALFCLPWTIGAVVHAQPSSPSTPLTVGSAVAEALAASPALQAQRARVSGEQAAAPLAGRLPNPSISWLGEGLARRPAPPAVLQQDHGVFVVQSIPLGGRLGAERRLAEADVLVASTALDAGAEALALDVVMLFVDALRTSQSRAVLDQRLAGLDELVRIQQRRVDEGTAPSGDLGRLQAERARVRVAAARLDAEARRIRVAICAALGRPTCEGWDVQAPPSADAAPPPADPAVIEPRVDARPTVRAALSRLEQARFAKALADASVWPSLDVTGGYKRTQFLDTGMAGLSITVPLFDRQQAPRARADAALEAATLEVEQARRVARAQLLQAVGLAADLSRQAAQVDLLAPALTSQRAARSAFREGDADLVRLLDAERLVADAQLDALSLTLDALQASLQARVLLGLPLP
jgi:cobalt-zinc-cadmium efflux system outer membrane protein